jgi:uncharacterized protein GlcG (DUF336 family)
VNAFQELKRFSDVCEDVAGQRGIPICVTVVDAHGHPVLLRRMPGSPVLALEMAERKAYTSVVMGMETNALGALVQPGQPLFTLTSSSSRLVAFGGGSRVELGGEAFGVGISGGTTQEDMEMLRDARLRFGQGEWAPDSMS